MIFLETSTHAHLRRLQNFKPLLVLSFDLIFFLHSTKRSVQLLVLYGLFFEFISTILFFVPYFGVRGENVWIINMFKKLATWKFESILFIIFVRVSIGIVLKPHKREITDKSCGNRVFRESPPEIPTTIPLREKISFLEIWLLANVWVQWSRMGFTFCAGKPQEFNR